MSVLGISLGKGQIRYCVLDGDIDNPEFIEKGKLEVDPNRNTPELMGWFKTNFEDLIMRCAPDVVAYRMFWNINTQEQTKHHLLPLGILNMICFQNNLPIIEFGAQAITAKKLNLPRGTKPIDVCDEHIGNHPPHWDNNQRNAALAAWCALPESD